MSKLQGTISSQLTNLRPKIKTRRATSIKDPAPSPMHWRQDGEDHINISERAETDLGKALAHNSNLPFIHKIFGRFSNMESFWHYIQSEERDDRVRLLTGPSLKNFSRKLTSVRVPNFRAIVMDSNYQRIVQYKPIAQSMKETTLPFDCYYVDKATGLRQRPSFFKWFIEGMEEIRKALKEDREPDFSFLLERRNSGIYEFVLPPQPVVEAPAVDRKEPTASLLTTRAPVQEENEVPQVQESVDNQSNENTSGGVAEKIDVPVEEAPV